MNRVYMKDGATVFAFPDAKDLRRLLHDHPGRKPQGGHPVEARLAFRVRDEHGQYTGELHDAGQVLLRYVSRTSIAHVEQDATTQEDRPFQPAESFAT